jgi:hypothetical protein
VVVIRVMTCRALFVGSHCDGSGAVSCFMTAITLVRKHPVIVRMIRFWTEDSAHSSAVVGAVLVSPGLCQIIAA